MYFKTLKDKCEYYRSLTDTRLLPNSYVIVMVDGHCFSKMIKNKFRKPFDSDFIDMMNETAKYLCENIQGVKFAYTQSDEISLLITDFDTSMTDSFFSFRTCKMLSLISAMATAKFNQMYTKHLLDIGSYSEPTLCTFDCKVWTVPSANDAYAWFLYRQTDCIRNSKQQTAQTYLPHKALVGLHTDEQVEKTKNEKGIDWHMFPDDRRYGRVIKKVEKNMEKDLPNGEHIKFTRNVWTAVPATEFSVDNKIIKELIPNRE